MSPVFPELLVSLTVQCTLLLIVTRFLVRRAETSAVADYLWSFCHLLILLLSLAGILLPHARLFRGASLLDFCHRATSFPISQLFWLTIFCIWVSVSVALAANLLRSLFQMSLMIRNATDLRPSDFVEVPRDEKACCSLATELNGLNVQVVMSETCVTPYCWQLHRPVIVLPEFLSTFAEDELRAVVRHELAHLKARHPLRLFLQRLVEIVFWFHPLVWHTSRDAALQRELSADCLANSSQADAASFLRSLVRLADFTSRRTPKLSIGLNLISGGASMIQRRVDQLLSIDWASTRRFEFVFLPVDTVRSLAVLVMTGLLAAGVWIPLNSHASPRTFFSPWPTPTATLLHEAGIEVRDYELDSHRITEHLHNAH